MQYIKHEWKSRSLDTLEVGDVAIIITPSIRGGYDSYKIVSVAKVTAREISVAALKEEAIRFVKRTGKEVGADNSYSYSCGTFLYAYENIDEVVMDIQSIFIFQRQIREAKVVMERLGVVLNDWRQADNLDMEALTIAINQVNALLSK